MILEKIDEGGRSETAARLSARFPATENRSFALIDEPRAERAGDIAKRRLLMVAVVALRFAGQQNVPGVMVVIVPLGTTFALRWVPAGIEDADAVIVVFEHKMDVTPALGRQSSCRETEFVQHRTGFPDTVHGIE